MIMLVDTLSERYGILPSEVMTRATTFDVFIADTAIGYRNTVQEREASGAKKPAANYKQEDLRKMLDRVNDKNKLNQFQ
jgi:hypothetical protein